MLTITERHAQELEQFHRDGYILYKQALRQEQVGVIKQGLIEAFADKGPEFMLQGPMFERGEAFEELIDQPGVIDFIEEVVGPTCQLSSMNGMRTLKDNAVSMWHVDEALFLPLPDGVKLDDRIQLPVYLCNALYYLDDVTEELGPTQVVPGSHRAGKHVDNTDEIGLYEGKGPISILAEAGDCLIFNSQLWHRGAPNQTNDPRYVQQIIYRKKFITPRMCHDDNASYQVPPAVLARANPRRKRLLGYNERIF